MIPDRYLKEGLLIFDGLVKTIQRVFIRSNPNITADKTSITDGLFAIAEAIKENAEATRRLADAQEISNNIVEYMVKE